MLENEAKCSDATKLSAFVMIPERNVMIPERNGMRQGRLTTPESRVSALGTLASHSLALLAVW